MTSNSSFVDITGSGELTIELSPTVRVRAKPKFSVITRKFGLALIHPEWYELGQRWVTLMAEVILHAFQCLVDADGEPGRQEATFGMLCAAARELDQQILGYLLT